MADEETLDCAEPCPENVEEVSEEAEVLQEESPAPDPPETCDCGEQPGEEAPTT